MLPLTRGSTAIWRSIMAAMARVTASMSALTKFSVTGLRERRLLVARLASGSVPWACNEPRGKASRATHKAVRTKCWFGR